MPVNLAAIPEVRTNVRTPDGRLEGYLTSGRGPDIPLAPIGLGHFREQPVGGYPDGTGKAWADPARHLGLDLPGHRQRLVAWRKGRRQLALHLVNRPNLADVDAGFDDLQQPAMVANVKRWPLLNNSDFRAHSAGVGYAGAHLYSAGFGGVTGGDAAGRFGQHRHYPDGLPPQLRPLLLLARGEEAVEIDCEATEGHIPDLGTVGCIPGKN